MKTLKLLLIISFLTLMSSVFSQDFNIYVSDAGHFNNPPWQILKFDENGTNPEVFISDSLAWPQDIIFLENENSVLISNLNSGKIIKYNATTGIFVENFATGLGGPTRMKIGPDSLLYVLQWLGDGKVFRYQLDGTFVDEFTSLGVTQSIGLDWDDSGSLYVSSFGGKYVRKFDSDGNDMGAFISTGLAGPTNIWFDAGGDLLVNDYSAGNVKRFDPQGNYLGVFISGLSQNEGIAYQPDGNILIGNGGTHSVKMFDSEGTYIEDIVPGGSGGLLTPNVVVLRNVIPLSVPQSGSIQELNFVSPNVGKFFYINPGFYKDIKSIEVYDTSGMLIKKADINGRILWSAQGYPEGIYFISAFYRDGHKSTQRILVKN